MSDPAPTRPSRRRLTSPTARRAVVIAVPALAMLGLGIWGLNRPSMYGSEADSYWAAQLSFGRLFHLLGHIDAVHGTYYLLLHLWFAITVDPTWMRVPCLAAMCGAVAMTAAIAYRLTSSRLIALVAGLLLAFLPSMSAWAQSGRSYAIVTFAVTVLVWTLLRAVEPREGRSWQRWVAFGAATVVAGYLHEMTLLLVPAFAVTLLWARVGRRAMLIWASTSVVAIALISPLLVISHRESRAVGYLRPPGTVALRHVFAEYFGPTSVVPWLLVALAVLGCVPRRPAADRGVVTPAMLALPLTVLPVTLLFAESHISTPLFDDRYVLYGAVGACLLAATGVHRIGGWILAWTARGHRLPALLPALVVCVLALVSPWSTQQSIRTPGGHGQDYGDASAYLARNARPGDGLVFLSESAHSVLLGYPDRLRELDNFTQRRSAAQAGRFVGAPISNDELVPAMLAHRRIWSLGPYPPRRSPTGLHGLVSVLTNRYRPVVIRRFTGVADVLWVRRSTLT